MAISLRDQLLKAGLVNEKQVKQATKQQHKQQRMVKKGQAEEDKSSQLAAQQAKIGKEIASLMTDALDLADSYSNARNEQIARRKDVERLKSQYQQILADESRAREQKAELEELLHRLNGTLTLLERRTDFLAAQFDSGVDPAYETEDDPLAPDDSADEDETAPVEDAVLE